VVNSLCQPDRSILKLEYKSTQPTRRREQQNTAGFHGCCLGAPRRRALRARAGRAALKGRSGAARRANWPILPGSPAQPSGTVATMPRPISGNQLNKLGKRLADEGPISDEDYELLGQVAEFYQAVTDTVQERLRNLGFEPTTRGFKSTGTLIDKLRRTGISLKDIQDLGGARIVIDGRRLDQDHAVERIMEAFANCPKAPVKIDRREQPSYGYRAVHVIVFEDHTPMEIQIRTKLQDTWAQISEKLGDMWGRGHRYGDSPDQPDAPAFPGSSSTRSALIGQLLIISDTIDRLETSETTLSEFREQMLELDVASRGDTLEQVDRVAGEVATAKAELQDALDRLLGGIRREGGAS
jgi:hypothetical protein